MTEFLFARLGEIQAGTNVPGSLNFTLIASPGTPVAGTVNLYAATGTKTMTAIDDAGRVTVTVNPFAAVANQFLTAISSSGTVSAAQPAFSNISGTALPAQGGTGIANNNASTVTISGAFGLTLTLTAVTSVTLPTSGTLVATSAAGTNGQFLVGVTGALPAFATMSGDVTTTNAGVVTIANSAITNAKQANMAAWTLKMNNSGAPAAPQDVTIDGLTAKASPVGADEVAIWDVAGAAMKKATITSVVGVATNPTTQTFLTGSGTYTTPAGAKWLRVRLVGGGAGGAGGNNPASQNAGGNTTFSTLAANGAAAGTQTASGAPGTASGGFINVSGGSGGVPIANQSTLANGEGGDGGNGALGGGGGGGYGAAGSNGSPNTGAGGGGGGVNTTSTIVGGAGGSSGGYCEAIIVNPAASYAYAVGAGGAGVAAGTNGFAGGNGAAGGIWVEEHYGG